MSYQNPGDPTSQVSPGDLQPQNLGDSQGVLENPGDPTSQVSPGDLQPQNLEDSQGVPEDPGAKYRGLTWLRPLCRFRGLRDIDCLEDSMLIQRLIDQDIAGRPYEDWDIPYLRAEFATRGLEQRDTGSPLRRFVQALRDDDKTRSYKPPHIDDRQLYLKEDGTPFERINRYEGESFPRVIETSPGVITPTAPSPTPWIRTRSQPSTAHSVAGSHRSNVPPSETHSHPAGERSVAASHRSNVPPSQTHSHPAGVRSVAASHRSNVQQNVPSQTHFHPTVSRRGFPSRARPVAKSRPGNASNGRQEPLPQTHYQHPTVESCDTKSMQGSPPPLGRHHIDPPVAPNIRKSSTTQAHDLHSRRPSTVRPTARSMNSSPERASHVSSLFNDDDMLEGLAQCYHCCSEIRDIFMHLKEIEVELG
ncbi:hypothetical protein F5Y11DRAFT_126156 [Daldinia sp. FL1419]|nr:hypothetical protein F5Y11DRAFT_126156 [Daldinia sp. FL1419]